MAQRQIEFSLNVSSTCCQFPEIEQVRIKQVRRHGVAERRQHRSTNVRDLFFKLFYQSLDARAFQVWLRAAQIAGNDREPSLRREFSEVAFAAVSQRANYGITSVVRTQDGRHRLQRANVE